MNYDEKVTKFQGLQVMLQGQPAKIAGYRNKFASIATLDPNGPVVEYAWPTVNRIVQNAQESNQVPNFT